MKGLGHEIILGDYMDSKFQIFALLGICLCIVSIPVSSEEITVPGDLDSDRIVSDQELEAAENSCKAGKISTADFEYIRHVHFEYPRTITDSAGHEITFWKPVERIVCFSSDAYEVLKSLKAHELVVGIDGYSMMKEAYFPELDSTTSIGIYPYDMEVVMGLSPDLVLRGAYGGYGEDTKKRLELGDPRITVALLDFWEQSTYVDEIRKLGYILEKEDEAEEYLEFYSGHIDRITKAVETLSNDEKPRVYLESPTDYSSYAEGDDWRFNRLELAGGYNIFGDSPVRYPTVDPESVLVKDPEIVLKYFGYGDLRFGGYYDDDPTAPEALRQKMIGRPGWENITAVKNGQVYVLSNEILGGASHLVGIAYLAKLFQPELFRDMDPIAIHQEYLTRFQGLDYDVREHGIFIYPYP